VASDSIEISISDKSASHLRVHRKALSELSQQILNQIEKIDSTLIPDSIQELSLLVTTDPHIQELNRDFRGKDKPTDVLSFPQLEGDHIGPSPISLGDVVISLDTTLRQAQEIGHSPGNEVLRLLIHGILHLLGYDHEDVPEEEVLEMQRVEDQIFDSLQDLSETLISSNAAES
jgi:probable rRNA maturation factor